MLSADELGFDELSLIPIIVFRLTVILIIPFILAFFFHSYFIKIPLYFIVAALFWNSVKVWGQSAISIMICILSVYLYFEIKSAPSWLAYLIGFLIIFNILFIKKRLKEIDDLNKEIYGKSDQTG
jgi:magnesium-transporting ATPase (P-type)